MMRLLDLFCGAGGCSAGYARAGFDVTGIDIMPQPRYPYRFVQADATKPPVNMDRFDVIHASPPCQDHSSTRSLPNAKYHGTGWMLEAVREMLRSTGKPYVIENVATADMPGSLVLCGTEFGLTSTMPGIGRVWLKRHRRFESNVFLIGAGGCSCYGRKIIGVYGHGTAGHTAVKGPGQAKACREVMGIDWMTRDELDEAIPPAYTEFIGDQLMEVIRN